MRIRLPLLLVALAALLSGCGGSSSSTTTTAATTTTADETDQRLDFAYDETAPLGYVDRGRANARRYKLAVHDVTFRSQGKRIEGYLILPPGERPHPAVVLVHGSGGDRRELLADAAVLAAKGVVAFVITEPSTSSPPKTATTATAYLAQAQDVQVRDVVAVRRAVDVLQTLASVDPDRIGYLGWSAGGRTGTFIAAAEPRVKALALLSTGAAPLSAFVAQAPANLRPEVRRVLGSVDPLRYIAAAKPGTVLLEDGRRDEVVPRAALLGIAHAAPKGTPLRWYDTSHALDDAAYRDAFAWLARKLRSAGG